MTLYFDYTIKLLYHMVYFQNCFFTNFFFDTNEAHVGLLSAGGLSKTSFRSLNSKLHFFIQKSKPCLLFSDMLK